MISLSLTFFFSWSNFSIHVSFLIQEATEEASKLGVRPERDLPSSRELEQRLASLNTQIAAAKYLSDEDAEVILYLFLDWFPDWLIDVHLLIDAEEPIKFDSRISKSSWGRSRTGNFSNSSNFFKLFKFFDFWLSVRPTLKDRRTYLTNKPNL